MTPNQMDAPSRRDILRRAQAAAQVLGMAALVGCHKRAPDRSSDALAANAVKQSLDGLKNRFGDLKQKFMSLRAQVDAIPQDLPGFADFRVKFYATEEGRGTTEAKTQWLSSRLDSAIASGNRGELDEISKDIAATYDDIGKIDDAYVRLLHQMMAFQRMAGRAQAEKETAEKEAEERAQKPSPPSGAHSVRAKPKSSPPNR